MSMVFIVCSRFGPDRSRRAKHDVAHWLEDPVTFRAGMAAIQDAAPLRALAPDTAQQRLRWPPGGSLDVANSCLIVRLTDESACRKRGPHHRLAHPHPERTDANLHTFVSMSTLMVRRVL